MLKKIIAVKGIGLLHDATGGSQPFDKTTLIYAENGRGKSTLASVFHSCATGDASLINNRKTLDGTNSPEVQFLFDNGVQISFAKGAWINTKQNMHVFDANFVEKNIYSGSEISAGHRQGLLEFALGSKAVKARKDESDATAKFKHASDAVGVAEKALAGYHTGIQLAEFAKLQTVLDADQQIEALEKRVAAAKNNLALQQRAVPSTVPEPALDLDAFFVILSKTLQEIETDAEDKVKAHFAKHGGYAAEDWANRGLALGNDVDCPFCGQSINGNELIKAYRTYFNAAYTDLKKQVAILARGIEARIGDRVVEQFAAATKHSQSISDSWTEHVSSVTFTFDKDSMLVKLGELRTLLSKLALAKQQGPLEVVGDETAKNTASILWQLIVDSMRACNKTISDSVTTINTFKAKLAAENVVQLQQQIDRLKLTKVRHQQVVVTLVNQWNTAKNDKTLADKAKADARTSLDALMKQILQTYQEAINALLKKFAASFEIAKMDSNYLGGGARTEYGLRLRGKDVRLSGGVPSFATTLSEGDKRTLAFAFFVAAVQSDPKLANSIVIIDDPMCSLDRNRRRNTRQVLKNIGEAVKQLIVLGHDLYFLRDLRDDLTPHTGTSFVKLIKLGRVQDEYTNFTSLDLDKECEADYYQHHRILTEFAQGTNVTNPRAVAKAIRPMLEGYLHRRFPNRIQRRTLFGDIVKEAKLVKFPDPLVHLQPLTQELNEINSYAGQFHHDTNAAADSVPVDDTELKGFAERALTVVHKGAA